MATLTGTDGDDNLVGTGDFPEIEGLAGNDTIDGGANKSFSAIEYTNSPSGVVINFATGVASDGFGGTDTFTNIDTYISSPFGDSITLTSGWDTFGLQYRTSEIGIDTIDGGEGIDTLSFTLAPSPVFVDMTAGTARFDSSNGIDFSSFLWIRGTNFDDTIVGGSAADTIIGGSGWSSDTGNDSIIGGAGDDSIFSYAGNDTIIAGSGVDTITPGGGDDLIDGGGGLDRVSINTSQSNASLIQNESTGTWTLTTATQGIKTLSNIEWVDFTDGSVSTLEQFTRTPTVYNYVNMTISDTSPFTLREEVVPTEYFSVQDFGFLHTSVNEQFDEYYYPTSNDFNPAGYFLPDPHSAVTGDFNADGYEDVVLGWIHFSHTVERQTPSFHTVLVNDQNGSLYYDPTVIDGNLAERHYAYRIESADFNGDGHDDFVAAPMGLNTRNSDGSSTVQWEPIVLYLSNGLGKLVDASTQIEGQESGGPTSSDFSFSHEISSGDIDGDGDIDLLTGRHFFTNDGTGKFTNNFDKAANLGGYDLRYTDSWATELVDLNNDGYSDVVYSFAETTTLSQNGESGIILLSNGQADMANWTPIKLPEGRFGISNTKIHAIDSADLNGDGFKDIVIGETRANPYYDGRYIKILMNNQGQSFSDETEIRLGTQTREQLGIAEGESFFSLRDANGDGTIDIIDQGTGDIIGTSQQSGAPGTVIYLNDGVGGFTMLPWDTYSFVHQNSISEFSLSADGAYDSSMQRGIAINIDGKNGLEFVSFVQGKIQNSPQTSPHEISLYVMKSEQSYPITLQSSETSTLSIADASATEADSFASTMTFTVTLSAASTSEVTVQYATSDGTATAGTTASGTTSGSSDYTATSGTLTFAAGETSKTISVSITGDIAIESDETFTMTLSNASGATLADATATGTITENETSVWSGQAYVDANPDLAAAGVTAATALDHYAAFGYAESRLISFDAAAYLEVNPDVAAAGITTTDAITHYINFGKNENRPFSADAYLNANPDLVAAGMDAAGAGAHFANFGKNEGRSPGFDAAGYALANDDLVAAGYTVSQFIEHWNAFGQSEGRSVFDPGQYFAANTSVATAGSNAYLHYQDTGKAAGLSLTKQSFTQDVLGVEGIG